MPELSGKNIKHELNKFLHLNIKNQDKFNSQRDLYPLQVAFPNTN